MVKLKCFLEVAKTQNIHSDSRLLGKSPSAVSKAVSRLEKELEIKLFEKVGRNIKITFSVELIENNYSADLAILSSPTKLSEKMYKKLEDVEFKLLLLKSIILLLRKKYFC